MKKNHYLIFLILLSLFPLLHMFTTSYLFHSHDGLVHLPRMAAYYKALSDGQFPIRWAGDLNYGYGLPLFNFIYQTPYLISSIFLFLGFDLAVSFKLTLALSFLLSSIFMFLFAREFFKDQNKAFLVSVFYQFATFRLVELFVRGSFGEIYAYTFLPLVIFGLIKLINKRTYLSFFITSIATSLLILSHNSVSLLFFGICLLFVLFFSLEKNNIFYGVVALGVGLILAAFYWMPAIFEHKYTYGDLFMKDLYKEHFANVSTFFLPNFTNSSSLQIGGVSLQIGLFHVLAIVLSAVLIFRKKLDDITKKTLIFSLALFLGAFFFMTKLSEIFWNASSVLRQFQFPWRFLSIIVFATSISSVSYLSFPLFRKKFVFIILTAFVVLASIGYWKASLGYDKIVDSQYWNFPLTTTYYGETDLIWSEGPAKKYPKQRIEIIDGEGEISNFTKKSNVQFFNFKAEKDSKLVSHTQYFPGWRVYVDGVSVPIQFQDPNHRGLIAFDVLKGVHDVKIVFEESRLRMIADIISVSMAGLLLLLYLFKKKVFI